MTTPHWSDRARELLGRRMNVNSAVQHEWRDILTAALAEREQLMAQVETLRAGWDADIVNWGADIEDSESTIAEQARRIEALERSLNSPYEVRVRRAETRIEALSADLETSIDEANKRTEMLYARVVQLSAALQTVRAIIVGCDCDRCMGLPARAGECVTSSALWSIDATLSTSEPGDAG